MCFVDVGANLGVFALLTAQQVGPEGLVIAFEPSQREFAALVRNIAANGLRNVLPLNLAVAERTGPSDFVAGPANHTGVSAIAVGSSDATVLGVDPEHPPMLDALVGERGIRLSGGSASASASHARSTTTRQFWWDQATGALDHETEAAVMDETVVIIVHRPTTVQQCVVLYRLCGGRVANYGPSSEFFHYEGLRLDGISAVAQPTDVY